MSSPSAKRRYLEELASAHGITLDDIYTIIYGETRFADYSIQQQVNTAITDDLAGMYFCLIWKGPVFPGAMANMQAYDYGGQVIEGLNLHLHKTPYHAQIVSCNPQFADYAYFERLVTKRLNCGVVVILVHDATPLAEVCRDYNRPLLFANYPVGFNIDEHYSIVIEDEAMTVEIVAYLAELGHTRIAFIHGLLEHQAALNRLNAYYAGLAAVGLPRDEALVASGNWREETGGPAAQNLLTQQPRPTAIIASNDQMALGALQAIKDAGLRVPQDVSLVGFDDLAISLDADPPLTTVRQPLTQIGMKAAETMIALLEGGDPQTRHQRLPLELIRRESTAVPPAS